MLSVYKKTESTIILLGEEMNKTGVDPPHIPFSLQLKPVGSACNINCHYCYVSPFRAKRYHVMSEEVLNRAIYDCLSSNPHPSITWHGGEPTLAGYDFFPFRHRPSEATLEDRSKSKEYRTNQCDVSNSKATAVRLTGWYF